MYQELRENLARQHFCLERLYNALHGKNIGIKNVDIRQSTLYEGVIERLGLTLDGLRESMGALQESAPPRKGVFSTEELEGLESLLVGIKKLEKQCAVESEEIEERLRDLSGMASNALKQAGLVCENHIIQ